MGEATNAFHSAILHCKMAKSKMLNLEMSVSRVERKQQSVCIVRKQEGTFVFPHAAFWLFDRKSSILGEDSKDLHLWK